MSIPIRGLLVRVRGVQPCCADIQVFIQLLLTFYPRVQQNLLGSTSLILKMSSSTDLFTSATQIVVKYNRVNDGGGQLVEKLSKS